MITLDDFQVYRYYLALKLHFTTDKYDVIKQKGHVRPSREAFNKRRDLYFIKKLSKKFDEKDIVNFLVANFVSGDRWGGVFDNSAETRYKEWQGKMEALSYNFRKDISYLEQECEARKEQFIYIFKSGDGQHPLILKEYLGKNISIETLVIINNINNFVDTLDKTLYNDIIWKDVSRLIKKYKPFLRYDKQKLANEFNSRF